MGHIINRIERRAREAEWRKSVWGAAPTSPEPATPITQDVLKAAAATLREHGAKPHACGHYHLWGMDPEAQAVDPEAAQMQCQGVGTMGATPGPLTKTMAQLHAEAMKRPGTGNIYQYGAAIGGAEPRLTGLNLSQSLSSLDRTREAIRQEMQADMTRAIDHERSYGERWHGMLHQIAAALELPEGYKMADLIPEIKRITGALAVAQTSAKSWEDAAKTLRGRADTLKKENANFEEASLKMVNALVKIRKAVGLNTADIPEGGRVEDGVLPAIEDLKQRLSVGSDRYAQIINTMDEQQMLGRTVADPLGYEPAEALRKVAKDMAELNAKAALNAGYTAADLDAKWGLGKIEGARQERERIGKLISDYQDECLGSIEKGRPGAEWRNLAAAAILHRIFTPDAAR